MNKKSVDSIFRERFLVWLMWLVPIACTGWISIVAWTVVQIMMYNSQVEKSKELKKPLRERPDIIEMNKEENLTEKDKAMMRNTKGLIKIGDGVYYYERE